MKKCKHLVCLMVAILVLFSGCGADDASRDPADAFNISGQNEIYFATGNDYYDLYVGYSWIPGPEIVLLSREYLAPEAIHVSADIQAEYTVHVTQQETGASLTNYEIVETDEAREVNAVSTNVFDFPLYMYQTYAGIDWTNVGLLYTEYWDTVERHEAGELDASQVKEAFAAYSYAVTEYVPDYTELKLDDIPRFYEYLIQITIDDTEVEETFSTVQVTIGDTVYDVDIGEIYIRPNSGYTNATEYLSMSQGSPLWLNSYPFGTGIENCQSDIYYAEESVTLTGLSFWENTMSTVEVLDVTIVLSDSADGVFERSGIEIKWDGETPVYVEQGKYVGLYLTIQDERMKEINYHSNLYPVLEFECDGSTYELGSEIPLYRHYSDTWLLYAIGLDGVDMESYFNDYYYVQGSNWRSDVELTPWGSWE